MNFGNHLRRAVDHLLQVYQHILVARCRCRKKDLDCEATIMEISRIITTPPRNFKEAVSICIDSQAGIDELSQHFGGSLYGRASEVPAPVLLTYDCS